MSDRTAPPYRADHVGSLLRAIEDDAIKDVVRMQEDVGLHTATDGEFRRASWHMDFIYQLGGISKAPGNLSVKFHNADEVAKLRLIVETGQEVWG